MPVNSLLIKPAGPDCNLNCEYCFYAEKKMLFADRPVHRMSLETAEKVISQYLALAGPAASLGFQGGEPTLCGIDFFREIINLLSRYKRPDQQVAMALQTNGMLLDREWAKLLREHRVLVGLSVDGPADIHDAHRIDFAGKPTHQKVSATMAMLKEEGVDFNTLTVITRSNVRRGRELFSYFTEQGSGYMQFIPCVEAVDGRIADFSPTPEEYADFLIEVFDLWYHDGQPQYYVRMFDEMLIAFMEYRSPSCAFAPSCAANLVVEHDGTVYPCDFFVDPQWRLGSIHEKSMEDMIADPLLTAFINRKRTLDDRCQGCRWQPLCFGDCPKYRLSPAGEAISSAYFCEGFQKFFEHAQPKMMALKEHMLRGDHPRSPLWRRMEASLGRNEPCPCGSGRKFKKCCQDIKKA